MRKKYLALVLTGIILATVAMGCGSKKTPTENNEVTTPAPETSSDEYTLPDETTSYNNEEMFPRSVSRNFPGNGFRAIPGR